MCGEVKRVIMGLDRVKKTPCGFCFVEYPPLFFTMRASTSLISRLSYSTALDVLQHSITSSAACGIGGSGYETMQAQDSIVQRWSVMYYCVVLHTKILNRLNFKGTTVIPVPRMR